MSKLLDEEGYFRNGSFQGFTPEEVVKTNRSYLEGLVDGGDLDEEDEEALQEVLDGADKEDDGSVDFLQEDEAEGD